MPADDGVTELDAGTELAAPMVTVEVDVGVPVHVPLLKNAYVTVPVTPVEGIPPVIVA